MLLLTYYNITILRNNMYAVAYFQFLSGVGGSHYNSEKKTEIYCLCTNSMMFYIIKKQFILVLRGKTKPQDPPPVNMPLNVCLLVCFLHV